MRIGLGNSTLGGSDRDQLDVARSPALVRAAETSRDTLDQDAGFPYTGLEEHQGVTRAANSSAHIDIDRYRRQGGNGTLRASQPEEGGGAGPRELFTQPSAVETQINADGMGFDQLQEASTFDGRTSLIRTEDAGLQ